MPNYKGHLLGGVGFFVFAHYGFSNNCELSPFLSFNTLVEFLLCLFGSLIPDVDIHSYGRKVFDKLLFCLLLIVFYLKRLELVLLLISMLIFTRIVGHRKLTHNPLFISLAPFCFWGYFSAYFNWICFRSYYFAFIIGVFSHLILDSVPKKFLPKIMFK